MNLVVEGGLPGARALLGDTAGLIQLARLLAHSSKHDSSAHELQLGSHHLGRSGHSASITNLAKTTARIHRGIGQAAETSRGAASAVEAYALRVSELQQGALALRQRLAGGKAFANELEHAFEAVSGREDGAAGNLSELAQKRDEVARANSAVVQALAELDRLRELADSRCVAELGDASARLNSGSFPTIATGLGAWASPAGTRRMRRGWDMESPRSLRAILRDLPGTARPAEVDAWWAQLSERERETLLRIIPRKLGNLNGIPIEDRIAANAMTAERLSERPGLRESERDYWRKAASGEVNLVGLDPEEYRIIEMLGEIGPKTEYVVTYLPGTAASLEKFFEGGPQSVGKFLASKESGEKGVVFVYKDGPWVTWIGERSNRSERFAKSAGESVAQFQHEVVERHPVLGQKKIIGIGHSAGVSCLTSAEVAGAHFEMVFSMGGSWIAPGWKPQPETGYHHLQYDQDMINRLDHVAKYETPHAHPEQFTQHVFQGNGQGELRGHARIAEDERTNWAPLDRIRDEIEGRNIRHVQSTTIHRDTD